MFIAEVEDFDQFTSLLNSTHRRLPIVAISELNGETLAGNLHERIAENVCGLAHTIKLSMELSWALTERMGREWSCFNGAVRIYWPFHSNRDNFRMHPLWTLDRISMLGDTEKSARDGFIKSLTRNLIEASTFVASDGRFSEFEAAKLLQVTEGARAAAESSGDYRALADAYADENDILRQQVDVQHNEITDLRQNIEALTTALRSVQIEPEAPMRELPPENIAAAIAVARRELSDHLIIAPETESDWLALNPAAGPPEKILRYLRTLGEMSQLMSGGQSLGATIPIWLRQRNVECSIDSQTSKQSKADRAFRERTIEGKSFECNYHAKPADQTSPDMCVRIYFTVAEENPKIRIGYIGRHSQ